MKWLFVQIPTPQFYHWVRLLILSYLNFFKFLLYLIPISLDIKSQLDKPVSIDEETQAIKSMQSDKSPNLNGFPIEIKKKKNSQRSWWNPYLIPQSLRQASISWILEKDKNWLYHSSFRPVSLYPADAKVLAQVLAQRLEFILPKLIHIY